MRKYGLKALQRQKKFFWFDYSASDAFGAEAKRRGFHALGSVALVGRESLSLGCADPFTKIK